MKIFARQISPEYQESPLFLDEAFFPDNITMYAFAGWARTAKYKEVV